MTGLANCKKIDIMPTYHYVQNEILMIQSRENGEKPQFGHFFFFFTILRPDISELQIFLKIGFIKIEGNI